VFISSLNFGSPDLSTTGRSLAATETEGQDAQTLVVVSIVILEPSAGSSSLAGDLVATAKGAVALHVRHRDTTCGMWGTARVA
jgi:hypothetical protein